MKLILLDDNKETYEVLKDVASLSESEIVYFTDIEEAKRYIQENQDIDGIISEVYVNGKPTVQIVHFIRKLELKIPFIILTENISEEDKEYFKL
jgi:DNA-binding response OmpR family regulator